jgi:hypothetical protein
MTEEALPDAITTTRRATNPMSFRLDFGSVALIGADLCNELLFDLVIVVSSSHWNTQDRQGSNFEYSINIAVSCDSIGTLVRRTVEFYHDNRRE